MTAVPDALVSTMPLTQVSAALSAASCGVLPMRDSLLPVSMPQFPFALPVLAHPLDLPQGEHHRGVT